MGNEASGQLKGLEMDERAIETTDLWRHYAATVVDPTAVYNLQGYASISVFKSDGPDRAPLDKCAVSLMRYRHPCILRYVLHWQSKGASYLATEPAKPLSQALSAQHSLQVCVGLHQILQALDFLHGKALQSHNNISIASIYVLPDGSWKLAGMDLLKPFGELNHSYLKQIKKFRYDQAIDDKEETSDDLKKIDQFAFGVLVEDVLKGRSDDNLPHLKEFRDYCKKELQNPTASRRIPFSTLLRHAFFNHEFLSIHKFLTSLPVKSEAEKRHFFAGLLEKLRNFSEETVAVQLGGLLLSRLVLLNSTAREQLLPYLLLPKENDSNSVSNMGLFSLTIFKHHVTPQLVRMFKVRDTQVRMLLLKHFSRYVNTFNDDDLTGHVLPELLLGIKDTDDTLVSMTLYCLADLIPILGASTVIGPKRRKIFADGRPMVNSKLDNSVGSFNHKASRLGIQKTAAIPKEVHKTPTLPISIEAGNDSLAQNLFDTKEFIEIGNNPCLLERPSPDGGEDLDSEILKNSITNEVNASEDDWSDWEQDETKNVQIDNIQVDINDENEEINALTINNTGLDKIDEATPPNPYYSSKMTNKDPSFLQKAAIDAKSKKLADIFELDIKNQKQNSSTNSGNSKKDEFDFFTDMEPVIEKANVLAIASGSKTSDGSFESDLAISAKLNFAPVELDQSEIGNSAWDDVDWDGD